MKEKRKIGRTGLEVIPFALGGNVFGWTADEKASYEILDAYADAGFDLIDTADIYSTWETGNRGGESETIIGNWLRRSGKRDQMVICTKVGGEMTPERKGLRKQYIIEAAEESLRRLQTDRIDLYFTHLDDPETPVEETLEAYGELIASGKVRYIGASNLSPERIMESVEFARRNDLPEYVCLQPQYNLLDRQEYETLYEPLVREYGLGVICYYSLASGFLTGKYKTVHDIIGSKRAGQLRNYANQRGEDILKALDRIALRYNATPGQIALAWLLNRPTVTAPIASVSRVSQLDILQCVQIELDKESDDELTAASAY